MPLFDWKPTYVFLSDLLLKDLVFNTIQSNINITTLSLSIAKLAKYFNESSPQEIYDFFVPKYSPRATKNDNYIILFLMLYPSNSPDYKKVIRLLLDVLENTISTEVMALGCGLLNNFLRNHPLDDNSEILDFVLTRTITFFFYDTQPFYLANDEKSLVFQSFYTTDDYVNFLAAMIFKLFVSPKTRERVLTEFGIIWDNARAYTHPSIRKYYANSLTLHFIREIIANAKILDAVIRDEKGDYTRECLPSLQEYEKFFEHLVTNLIYLSDTEDKYFNLFDAVYTILNICPSFTNRFYNFSTQIIDMNDTLSVTSNAWVIMSACITVLQQKDDFLEKIAKYVKLAIENFYIPEIQLKLSLFLETFFCYAPLKKETEFPKEIEQEYLICTLFDAIVDYTRQTNDTGHQILCFSHNNNVFSIFYTLLSGADKEYVHTLLKHVLALICDFSLYHAYYEIIPLISIYSIFAPREDLCIIYDELVRHTQRVIHDYDELRYLLGFLASIGRNKSQSEEESREVIQYLAKYRDDKERKVRKIGWNTSIAVICDLYGNLFVTDYKETNVTRSMQEKIEGMDRDVLRVAHHIKAPNCVPLDDIVFRRIQTKSFYPKLAEEMFIPHFHKISELTDPVEVYDHLKPLYRSIIILFSSNNLDSSRDYSNYTSAVQNTLLFKRPVFFESTLWTEIIQMLQNLHNKFKNNTIIEPLVIQIIGALMRYTPTFLTAVGLAHFINALEEHNFVVKNRFAMQSWMYNFYTSRMRATFSPVPTNFDTIIDIILETAQSEIEAISLLSFTLLDSIKNVFSNMIQPKVNAILLDPSRKFTTQFIIFLCFTVDTNVPDSVYPLFYRMLTEEMDFSHDDTEMFLINKFTEICFGIQIPVTSRDSAPTDEFLSKVGALLDKKSNEMSTFTLQIALFIITACLRKTADVPDTIWRFLISMSYNPTGTIPIISCMNISELIQRRMAKKNKKTVLPLTKHYKLSDHPPYTIHNIDGKVPSDFISASNYESTIEEIDAYDSESQGYYQYSKSYHVKENTFFFEDAALLESLPLVIKSIMSKPADDCLDAAQYVVFKYFKNVQKYLGPPTKQTVIDLIEDMRQEDLSPEHWESLMIIIYEIFSAIISWPKQSQSEFVHEVIVKHIIETIANPAQTGALTTFIASIVTKMHPSRISPVLNFLFSTASIDPDAPQWRRSAFSILTGGLIWAPHNFYRTHDVIVENFIRPVFANLEHFNQATIEDALNLVYVVLFCYTLPEISPLRVSSDKMTKQLFDILSSCIQNCNPQSKQAQYFIATFMDSLPQSYPAQIRVLFPVLIDNTAKMLKLLTFADTEMGNKLINALHEIVVNPTFVTHSENVLKFLINVYQNISTISTKLQSRVLNATRLFFRFSTYKTPQNVLEETAKQVRAILEKITDPNIKSSMLSVYGILLRRTKKRPVDILDHCAIINTSYLLDKREEETEVAFKALESKLQKCNQNEKQMILLIISDFWSEHSDQISSDVAEALDKYRTLSPPAYIT